MSNITLYDLFEKKQEDNVIKTGDSFIIKIPYPQTPRNVKKDKIKIKPHENKKTFVSDWLTLKYDFIERIPVEFFVEEISSKYFSEDRRELIRRLVHKKHEFLTKIKQKTSDLDNVDNEEVLSGSEALIFYHLVKNPPVDEEKDAMIDDALNIFKNDPDTPSEFDIDLD